MSQSSSTSSPITSRIVNRSPIFYGWIILLAGTIGMVMTSPGQTYVISVVLEPLLQELSLSRSWVSILYAFGTLLSGFALPYVGYLVDRFGPRSVVIATTIIAILSCFFMSIVQNAVMLTIAFILLRLFTHGSLTLVSQNVINQWWIRRRGMAMGLNGIVWGLLGFGAFPIIIRRLVDQYDWRWTYGIQGIMLLVIMLPVGALLFRSRPELFGLHPDGDLALSGEKAENKLVEENWTRQEAMGTWAFWIPALGVGVNGMMITGLFFHMESIFTDNGLATSLAALVFAPIALTNAVVNLGGGYLADRVPARFLLGGALLLLSAGIVMALYLTGPTMAMLYGVMLGTSIGMIVLVQNIIWANYFGREHLGAITGVATTILMIGNGLGPVPLGFARDLLGSYDLALYLLALLPFALGIGSLLVGKPEKA
ncbi:MAG: MFS transporter [Chloroflexota bacterium]